MGGKVRKTVVTTASARTLTAIQNMYFASEESAESDPEIPNQIQDELDFGFTIGQKLWSEMTQQNQRLFGILQNHRAAGKGAGLESDSIVHTWCNSHNYRYVLLIRSQNS